MVISSMFAGLASLLWLGVVAYIVFVLVQRARHKPSKISITIVAVLVISALIFSTLSTSVVIIDAREVGVVFNDIRGLRPGSIGAGFHIVTPFIDHVYRYSIAQQTYTMSYVPEEGAAEDDDSLWSRTVDGQKVALDATVFFEIDPAKADYVHTKWQDRYANDFVRPTVRGVTRSAISKYSVAEVYSTKREELRGNIEEELDSAFAKEGLLFKGFVIRNVNFTEEYASSIEQKQIAEQEAERMKFVVDREKQEAERKRVEAEGVKDAAIIRAEGEAESLRLINEALSGHPELLTYRYIEKLAPNVNVLMLPSGAPFILDPNALMPTGSGTTP